MNQETRPTWKRVLNGVLTLVMVIWFLGSHLIAAWGGDRTLMYLYWIVVAIGMFVTMPDRCPQGHTDFGFYSGRWYCRKCYDSSKGNDDDSVDRPDETADIGQWLRRVW